MNKSMVTLLGQLNLDTMRNNRNKPSRSTQSISLIRTASGVFLKNQLAGAKHISAQDFQDLTGMECFINHIHLPAQPVRSTFAAIIDYIELLKQALTEFAPSDTFEIIVSINGDDATVRFHTCRPGENWLSPNLDSYKEESIMVELVMPVICCTAPKSGHKG